MSATIQIRKPGKGRFGKKKFAHFIKPMLAKLIDEPFDDKDWVFEIKWDGYRGIAEIHENSIRFYSRNGLSLAERYPPISESLLKMNRRAILDGEIVVLDKNNRSDFQKLQQYEINPDLPLYYYVFDLLELDGKNIEHLPLLDRKILLKKLIPGGGNIVYCDHVAGKGRAFFKELVKRDLEGMIAKRSASEYQPGKRTGEWLKIKNHKSQEVVIVGYTAPKGERKYFGSLILGTYKNKSLDYVGHAGTGFTESGLKALYEQMQRYISRKPPFAHPIKTNGSPTWLKPVLVANVKYSELTENGQMRHPVFLGLRTDKGAKEVKTEIPKSWKQRKAGRQK